MTDMIERVARAIRASDQIDLPDDFCGVVDGDIRFGRALFQARAAIAAMREPTEDMGEAAVKDHDNHAYHMSSYHCVTEAWRNMIDAALGVK